jgi:hypothetical protein
LRSCNKSPACMAPASARAPATMLATTCPGATSAKTICESLPTPETGLRSVCPKARTASTATKHESATAKTTCHAGRANIGETTATHSASAAPMPQSHQLVGTSCEVGATSTAASRETAPRNWPSACSARTTAKAVSASATIRPMATHSTHLRAKASRHRVCCRPLRDARMH